MSTVEARELELITQLRRDFPTFAQSCLMIRPKEGAPIPFKLNRAQQYVHERLQHQLATKGRVRAYILKGRQMGISTYVAGRFYWRTIYSPGFRAFILTHLDTASENLFGFAKRFHEECPDIIKPETGKSNAKELNFAEIDSGYKVATAGSAEVGRSETIQLFHGSEMAFWPNAELHNAGLVQAIANVDGSEDIRESTANGIGGAFYKECKAAQRGESDYELIFLPWYWFEKYRETPPSDWRKPEAWAEYQAAYELDDEQIYWAWKKNRALCFTVGGTPEEPCFQFRQEYPGNADEAFQTAGEDTFIDTADVLRARKKRVEGYGPIILGVDPARSGGDKTGLVDRQGRKLGGHVCERIDSADLMEVAGIVFRKAQEIDAAKTVVDTTGLGAGLYDRLREMLGDKVEGVNFSEKALEKEKYANRRAEIWATMRQWLLDPAGVDIPDDEDLHGDLTAPASGPGQTRFDSAGRLVLEPKESIKKRLSFSPDLGDAAALTFAVQMAASPTLVRRRPNLGRPTA